jgi:hypothetical protein
MPADKKLSYPVQVEFDKEVIEVGMWEGEAGFWVVF